MAVLTIYGRVLLAMSFPRHELLTVVTVRPVCTCTHTPSCSIVQKETTWGRRRSRVNESQTSHGVPPRAIPVNNRVRSPPLLVHPGRDSLSLLACMQCFVFVHFRFVDREGRHSELFGLFYLCPRDSPNLFPLKVVASAPCCRPLQDFRICATLCLYARYLRLYEIILASRFSSFTGCFPGCAYNRPFLSDYRHYLCS